MGIAASAYLERLAKNDLEIISVPSLFINKENTSKPNKHKILLGKSRTIFKK